MDTTSLASLIIYLMQPDAAGIRADLACTILRFLPPGKSSAILQVWLVRSLSFLFRAVPE